MPRLIALAVALALVPASPAGAAEKVSDIDRFELANNCAPVRLVVEQLHDETRAMGLSGSQIETAVRSRLRAARIYTSDDTRPFVYVNVGVTEPAFSVSLEFVKRVTDYNANVSGLAITWRTRSFGNVGASGANFILSALSRHVDWFIDEYLRVNEAACRK